MSVRTFSQDVVTASLTIVAVAGISSVPSAAYAVDKNTADIQIANKTGREILFVTAAHTYSDNYRNTKTWGNLPNGVITKEPLVAEYNTGFLTTGKDWWIVTWQFKGDKTLYVTSPRNLQAGLVGEHGVEIFSTQALPIAARLADTALKAGKVAGAIGGPHADAMGSLLAQSESTVGFKQHILQVVDSKQTNVGPTVIEIGDKEVKFYSPSGLSSTEFRPVNGKK
jgi:Up-Regulated in long-lived daf-2